jgi:hypothetical protein
LTCSIFTVANEVVIFLSLLCFALCLRLSLDQLNLLNLLPLRLGCFRGTLSSIHQLVLRQIVAVPNI